MRNNYIAYDVIDLTSSLALIGAGVFAYFQLGQNTRLRCITETGPWGVDRTLEGLKPHLA
jgi:hypothetical protein